MNWKLKKSKIKKLIYKFPHNLLNTLKYPFNKLKTLHEILKQTDEDSLQDTQTRNVYQIFKDWILDTIQFGFICVITWIGFVGWSGIGKTVLLIFAFGVIPSIIAYLIQSIKGAL